MCIYTSASFNLFLVIHMEYLQNFHHRSGGKSRQIYNLIKRAIIEHSILPGCYIHSSRTTAQFLGVSRGTVLAAYEKLIAEGQLKASERSRTYVSNHYQSPPPPPKPSASTVLGPKFSGAANRKSEFFRHLGKTIHPQKQIPFAASVIDEKIFSFPVWRKLMRRQLQVHNVNLLGYASPQGNPSLRTIIAERLLKPRGITCSADEIIITCGIQQGIYLTLKTLFNRHDTVWTENPTYGSIRNSLHDAALNSASIDVDENGFMVEKAIKSYPHAAGAFVTPSHHYPLGVLMSRPRRVRILDWAKSNNAWIFEDDYARESVLFGPTEPPLFSMTTDRRVIYAGTFSKCLFPALRLGFLVIPADLVEVFTGARSLIDRHPPTLDEIVLADYINSGYLEQSIKKRRRLLLERRFFLETLILDELSDELVLSCQQHSLHLVAFLKNRTDDLHLSILAEQSGIAIRPLSGMYFSSPKRYGFTFGYSGFNAQQMRAGIARLKQIFLVNRYGAIQI